MSCTILYFYSVMVDWILYFAGDGRSLSERGVTETTLKAYHGMNQFLSSFIERVSQLSIDQPPSQVFIMAAGWVFPHPPRCSSWLQAALSRHKLAWGLVCEMDILNFNLSECCQCYKSLKLTCHVVIWP